MTAKVFQSHPFKEFSSGKVVQVYLVVAITVTEGSELSLQAIRHVQTEFMV